MAWGRGSWPFPVAGQRDELAPDLVLAEAVQGEVAQAGVFGGPDPVLAPGPAAVAQPGVGELAAGGAGGKADIRCPRSEEMSRDRGDAGYRVGPVA